MKNKILLYVVFTSLITGTAFTSDSSSAAPVVAADSVVAAAPAAAVAAVPAVVVAPIVAAVPAVVVAPVVAAAPAASTVAVVPAPVVAATPAPVAPAVSAAPVVAAAPAVATPTPAAVTAQTPVVTTAEEKGFLAKVVAFYNDNTAKFDQFGLDYVPGAKCFSEYIVTPIRNNPKVAVLLTAGVTAVVVKSLQSSDLDDEQ